MERISIFGLGYVGTVCAACLAQIGHRVVGVDSNPTKVALIASGRSPVIEKDIDKLIHQQVAEGRLEATEDVDYALRNTDLSFVCVGTPSSIGGAQDVGALEAVSGQIGRLIAKKSARHCVVIRSTILPGTTRNVIIPALEEASGKRADIDFDVAVNPEFMREGAAVADFNFPSRTVAGANQPSVSERILSLYAKLPGEKLQTDISTAELCKYIDNTWHALKVAFSNEIGSICKALHVDSHEAMRIFSLDKKLNISSAYLTPGFAFGGSCLPKDVRALADFTNTSRLDLPVIRSIVRSNSLQVERGVAWVLSKEKRKVSFLGLSFKAGTDDLRESPYLEMVERLLGKGCSIKIFDPNVEVSRLIGANRDFLMRKIPHVTEMLVSRIEEAVSHADLLVLTHADPVYEAAVGHISRGQLVLDFARSKVFEAHATSYEGFSW